MVENKTEDVEKGLSSEDLRSPGKMASTLGYSVYADILASTIPTLDTPCNVGIFAGWGSGKSYLLNKIKDNLEKKTKRLSTTNGTFGRCIVMLWRLVFFYPPKALRRSNDVRFINVYFNALEYAGSDHLWAGLVTRLVGAVECGIGILPSAVFRAKPPYRMPLQCIISSDPKKCRFHPMTLCGTKIPVYALFILVVSVGAAAGIGLLVYALELHKVLLEDYAGSVNETGPAVASATDESKQIALGSVFISIPVVAFCRGVIPVIIKIVNSQKSHVVKILSRRDFSQELGVMAKIKEEIRLLSKLVRYMELFEQRRIVVAIFIDELDKLPQQNIAPLLQAIKILLTDPGCRFVSILAIDPYSVSDALEMGIQSEFPAINISGHKFLKQMIQVPFSIPEMNMREKSHLFRMLEKRERKESESFALRSASTDAIDAKLDKRVVSVVADGNPTEDDKAPFLEKSSVPAGEVLGGSFAMYGLGSSKAEKTLDEYESVVPLCDSVMAELRSEQIFPFVKNNVQEMLRLVGILQVTARVIFRRLNQRKNLRADGTDEEPIGVTPRKLAAWIVLVGQWPYRTTWIVQHVEDRDDTDAYKRTDALCNVYRDVEQHFTAVKGWRKLIQLDGDPDSLERFLDAHSSWLNVGFLLKLLPHTISLDRSLKSIVAWTSVERDLKSQISFVSKPLSQMDITDVIEMIKTACRGSKMLEEYEQKCSSNNISGLVLLHGDLQEVKTCLGMTLGDWTLFSRILLRLRTVHRFKFSS